MRQNSVVDEMQNCARGSRRISWTAGLSGLGSVKGSATVLAIGLTISLMIGFAGAAYAQSLDDEQGPLPTLEITPGAAKAFRTAVLRFKEVGAPVGKERIAKLREEIEKGLAFSSVVLPLNRDAYLGPEDSVGLEEAGGFDCDTWRQSGADALLQGEVRRDGARLRADLRVWDVARCKELKVGSVVGDRDKLDQLGRIVADETVESLTGTRGVSSTEIAFISDRTGQRELYVMSADGRDARPATRSNTIKMFPEWVPDGRAILYISYASGQPDFHLTSRSDSVKPGPILRNMLSGRPKYRGRFDPTGEFVAVVSSVDGAAEIFSMKRRGGQPKRLTNDSGIDVSPSWSPDGKQIAFVSDRTGSPQLYIMNRDGGDLRRLTYTGSYNTSPAWSPDGRWIAYETRVRGQFDLWLIDPSGAVTFPIVEHARSDESPSWSPDSRKIAFSSARRGRDDIYVMDWNGENLMRLTGRSGKNIQPAWGPQSR